MDSNVTDKREQFLLDRSNKFMNRVLAEINAYWTAEPHAVLHALFEVTGAIASAMIAHDGARVEWILGMADALRARIVRDGAAVVNVPGKAN